MGPQSRDFNQRSIQKNVQSRPWKVGSRSLNWRCQASGVPTAFEALHATSKRFGPDLAPGKTCRFCSAVLKLKMEPVPASDAVDQSRSGGAGIENIFAPSPRRANRTRWGVDDPSPVGELDDNVTSSP